MSQRNHPANQAKCVWVCAHVSKRGRERKDSSTQPVMLIMLPQTAPMQCPCSKMKGALQCTWYSFYRLGPTAQREHGICLKSHNSGHMELEPPMAALNPILFTLSYLCIRPAILPCSHLLNY